MTNISQLVSEESEKFNQIAALIHSDQSPVGIDAKKTHILIIQMLLEMGERLEKLEEKIEFLSRN